MTINIGDIPGIMARGTEPATRAPRQTIPYSHTSNVDTAASATVSEALNRQ